MPLEGAWTWSFWALKWKTRHWFLGLLLRLHVLNLWQVHSWSLCLKIFFLECRVNVTIMYSEKETDVQFG